MNEKAVVPQHVEVVFDETASEKYGWLNNHTAWALYREKNGQGTLDYWQVCMVGSEVTEGGSADGKIVDVIV